MKKNKQKSDSVSGIDVFSLIMAIIALIFSGFAICNSFPRFCSNNFDYMGIITGSLSILVTLLIGWNIYSAIDATNKIKEMQNKLDELQSKQNEKSEELAGKIYKIEGTFYNSVVSLEEKQVFSNKEALYLDIIFNMISSIYAFSKAGEYTSANIYISYYIILISSHVDTIKSTLEKETKKGILELLFAIPNKEKLDNYEKFKKIIVELCM